LEGIRDKRYWPGGHVNGRVEKNRLHLLIQSAVYVPRIHAAFDEAVVGFNRQPVFHVFGDGVEGTLDSFRFCHCPQRP